MGWNDNGAIGNDNSGNQYTPLRIGTDSNWKETASGYSSNLALKTDGSLWAWSWNGYGQLGIGTTANSYESVQIGNDYDWEQISITTHSLAIKSNGTLWTWGRNNYGKLGIGNAAPQISTPTQVGSDTDWITAVAGFEHTIALKGNGTLWAWGHNNYGQLGDGTAMDKALPTQIGVTCDQLGQDEFLPALFSAYPNPVKNIFTIAGSIIPKKIKIFDMQGKSIMEPEPSRQEVDLSGVAAGIYICKIYTDSQTINLKIVKN